MPKLRTLSGDDLLRIPVDYVSTTAELPSDPQLHDFRGSLRDADATRRYGHQWVTSQSSVAICVPSVIIPVEYNVLLNLMHDVFQEVLFEASKPFEFDPRLLRDSRAIL